jgi:DNA-binding protein H-NS
MAKSSNIDLSKLSIPELQALAQDIETEIVTRRESERQRVLDQMRELAGSIGLSLEEMLGSQERGARAAAKAKVAAKYRHPDDPSLTWSGRGKRPNWVKEWTTSGKAIEDLAVV